jgi:hypothetical protein
VTSRLPVLSWLPVVVLCACGRGPSSTPTDPVAEVVSDWGGTHLTQSRKYAITVRSDPDPPVMGEFFTLEATITREDGTPVERAVVDLDARMPQHNHGMMTDPVMRPGDCTPVEGEAADPGEKKGRAKPVCLHEGGIYRSDGFKFHMGGEWTIIVDVDGPIGPDRTTFVYDMQ